MNVETVTPEVVTDATAELVVITQKYELATKTGADLCAEFAPLFKEASELVRESHGIVVTDASQKLKIQQAGLCRKALKANRIAAEKLKDSLKRDSLRYSNAVQGLYNYHLLVVTAEEERLEKQEKFVAIQEAERKAALKASRELALALFGIDTTFMALAEMPEATFTQLLENTRAGHEAKIARERQVEQDRIAAENERLKEEARIREENAKLVREAQEREAARIAEAKRLAEEMLERDRKAAEERHAAAVKLKEEQDRAKAQQEAAEAALQAERARLEAIAADERRNAAKAAEEAAARAKVEREAREKAEHELAEQRQAEEKRKKAEQDAARKAARAPDREKLVMLASHIRDVDFPVMNSEEARQIATNASRQLEQIAKQLEQEATKL